MKYLITIFFIIVICCLSIQAKAASSWYTCSIDEAGSTAKTVKIILTDTAVTPAFSQKCFRFPSTRKREMLSLALTAVVLEKNVRVLVDIESASQPLISMMYLVN